jgi:threonine dehydrogenase-like Zn-dependent dehydrogenase
MKALVLEDFGRLAVTDVDEPVVGLDDVVVGIIATGICGSDLHGYTGENGRRSPGQIMGHECVGIVEALGSGVDRPDLAIGSLVTVNPVIVPAEDADSFADREQHHPRKRVLGVDPTLVSAFAERIAVPERNVVALPPEMPVAIGAIVEPLAVGVNAVHRLGVEPGDAVLVLGGGPIGQAVVLALQMAGIDDILVSELSPSRRRLVESLGATAVDPKAGPIPSAVLTAFGRPADAAVDAVGVSATLGDALAATKLGAVVCLVGMGGKRLEIDAFAVSTAERSIVGSFTYRRRDFIAAAAWVSTAPPSTIELVSEVVGIDDADRAFRRLAEGEDVPGKILITFDERRLPAAVAH